MDLTALSDTLSLHSASFRNTESAQVIIRPFRKTWTPFLHIQYHYFWWTGDPRNQGINSHGIYLVVLEYAGLTIRMVRVVD